MADQANGREVEIFLMEFSVRVTRRYLQFDGQLFFRNVLSGAMYVSALSSASVVSSLLR